jgi:hypothetical protein
MMIGCQNEDEEGADEKEAAAIKATDAAVRHALIELQRDLLNFLYRRLGRRADAESVLQRFSLRALERESDDIVAIFEREQSVSGTLRRYRLKTSDHRSSSGGFTCRNVYSSAKS